MIIIGHDDVSGEEFEIKDERPLIGLPSICKSIYEDTKKACEDCTDPVVPVYMTETKNDSSVAFVVSVGEHPRMIYIAGIAYDVRREGMIEKPVVNLNSRNTVTVFCAVVTALKDNNVPRDRVKTYINEALNKSYDELIEFSREYVDIIL